MLPPMKKMIDNQELQDYFKEIGFWEAGITMLPHGVRYAFPYYGATLADAEIEGAHIVAQVITEIVTGTSTLEEAVAKAQKIIEEIHAKF